MTSFAEIPGQPRASKLLSDVVDQQPQCASSPVLLLGPSGSGRAAAGRQLLELWRSPSEPPVDLSGYSLVMDPDAPKETKPDAPPDLRYSVHRIRRQLSRQAVGPRATLMDFSGVGADVQNAMLKLLEEPPALTSLVLFSDGVGLLPTIRSRCQVIRFSALDHSALSQIAAANGWQVTDSMIETACGSAQRLRWLSENPEVAAAISAGDGPELIARLTSVTEQPGVTVTQARRKFCEMVMLPWARREGTHASGAAFAALRGGVKPEACLAMLLLGSR